MDVCQVIYQSVGKRHQEFQHSSDTINAAGLVKVSRERGLGHRVLSILYILYIATSNILHSFNCKQALLHGESNLWVCKSAIFISDFLLNTAVLITRICYVWLLDNTNTSVIYFVLNVYALATYNQSLPHLNSFVLEIII